MCVYVCVYDEEREDYVKRLEIWSGGSDDTYPANRNDPFYFRFPSKHLAENLGAYFRFLVILRDRRNNVRVK